MGDRVQIRACSTRERARSDGSVAWQVLWREDGRQRARTFDTVDARDTFAGLVRRIGLESASDALKSTETTRDFTTLTAYAHAEIDQRTGMTEGHRYRIHREVDRDWGRMGALPISAITSRHVREWVRGMERAGASGKTIRNKHGLLSSIMKAAVVDPDCPVNSNPCDGTKMPRVDSGDEGIASLTHNQFATLLSCFPEHYRPFVTGLTATGMRWSEATALSVGHLDTGRGELRVMRAWKKMPTGWDIGTTKTKRGRRAIPLGASMLRDLTVLAGDNSPETLLFRNVRGGRIKYSNFHPNVWTPALRLANGLNGWPDKGPDYEPSLRSIWKGIKPVGKAESIGAWPTPHDLRHTAASWMIEATGDLQAVQYMLGHESIQTTVDLYGDLMPGRKEKLAVAMEAAMSQALPQIEG